MSIPLPAATTVLIVGAGPIGLATAISLCKQGIEDIVVVDAQHREFYGYSSRASMIHASTLEVSAISSAFCVMLTHSVGLGHHRLRRSLSICWRSRQGHDSL